jgi:hypothetical protein
LQLNTLTLALLPIIIITEARLVWVSLQKGSDNILDVKKGYQVTIRLRSGIHCGAFCLCNEAEMPSDSLPLFRSFLQWKNGQHRMKCAGGAAVEAPGRMLKGGIKNDCCIKG